jgi:hypothetical protein
MPMPEPGPFREPDRPGRSRERLMWVTPDRLFYAGLLGAPSMHAKGALLVYVALDGPLRIRTGTGPWRSAVNSSCSRPTSTRWSSASACPRAAWIRASPPRWSA